MAVAEDVGRGDLFSKVTEPTDATGRLVAKSDGVLAGEVYVNRLAELYNFQVSWNFHDGDKFAKGDVIARVSGDSHTLMSVERVILNTVLHTSSIATLTRKYVEKIEPYGVKLLDTRKTRPLLREVEKYASKVGGAINHRMGLDDSLMLKDTHLKTIENLDEFLSEARKKIPFTTKIEIECEDVDVAKQTILKDVDIVMCDNMKPHQIIEVVKFRDEVSPRTQLEASGNISLQNIEAYAKTGVDAISTGSPIHQSSWIDISMKID
jgi:nicotinate-nucleotide pyrophosphorylase (carboxylating)